MNRRTLLLLAAEAVLLLAINGAYFGLIREPRNLIWPLAFLDLIFVLAAVWVLFRKRKPTT